jgi:hypothetical protein
MRTIIANNGILNNTLARKLLAFASLLCSVRGIFVSSRTARSDRMKIKYEIELMPSKD